MLVDLSRVNLVLRLVVQGTLRTVGFFVPIIAIKSRLFNLHGPALCSYCDLLFLFEVGANSRHSRTDSDGLVNGPISLLEADKIC